jgi:hypothetical protein
MQKYNLPKILWKETKILQDIIITSMITKLKFPTQSQKYHLSKILKVIIVYRMNESEHNILAYR